MNRFIIDTNIYSSAFKGESDIVAVLRHARHIGISSISVGELLCGFKAGKRESANRRALGEFLDSPRVALYSVDEHTGEFYSEILNELRRRGTPIPTNDIWIAATALQQGLSLYTLDKHFAHVPGLLLHRESRNSD